MRSSASAPPMKRSELLCFSPPTPRAIRPGASYGSRGVGSVRCRELRMSASNSSIEVLFQPFQLRGLTLRNRLVMAPMTRCFSPAGIPGPNVADYYRRRAAAGVGLVTTEGTGIDHEAAVGAGTMNEQNVPVLHGTSALAGWKSVVDAVHSAGGVIFPQLWHMGAIRVPGTGPAPDAP